MSDSLPYIHPPQVRRPLADYIREMANQMGLMDWTFILRWHPPREDEDDPESSEEDTVLATCRPTYGRKVATLRFSQDVRDAMPEQVRNTVAHELIHCHLGHAQMVVEGEMFDAIGKPHPWNELWASFRRALEYAVDGMASSWDEHLPLIIWHEDIGEIDVDDEIEATRDPYASSMIEKGFPPYYREWYNEEEEPES